MNLHDIIVEYKSEIISLLIGAVISVVIIIGFIGYKRTVWLVKELVKMYSADEKSYLSKKRIESGIAYIIAESGAIGWLVVRHSSMTTTDFVMWLSPQLLVAGWIINAIQKEKITNMTTDNINGGNDRI